MYPKKSDDNMTSEEKKAVKDYCAIYGVDKYATNKFYFERKSDGRLKVVNHD